MADRTRNTNREMNHEFPRAGRILLSHDRGPEYAVVTCVVCGREARSDDSEGVSDAELTREFEARGWTVKPTRCPEHVGVPGEENDHG